MSWYFSTVITLTIGVLIGRFLYVESRKKLRHLYFRDRKSVRDTWSPYGKFNFKRNWNLLPLKCFWQIWFDGETEFVLHYTNGNFKYVRVHRFYNSYLITVDADHVLMK